MEAGGRYFILIKKEPPKDACGPCSQCPECTAAMMKVCSGRNSAERLRRPASRASIYSGISARLILKWCRPLLTAPSCVPAGVTINIA